MSAATAQILLPSDDAAPTTRDRIVETAARSFQEIGYQKTTVADIARTLKMSPANVYRFFESKKAINEAVVEQLTGEIEAMIAAIADAPKLGAAERLTRIVTALHDDCRRRFEAHPRVHEMVEAAMSESWGSAKRMSTASARCSRGWWPTGCARAPSRLPTRRAPRPASTPGSPATATPCWSAASPTRSSRRCR